MKMRLFKPDVEKVIANDDVKGLIKAPKSNDLRVLGAGVEVLNLSLKL